MSIEKIIVRSLIVLAALFLILTLTFYPPSYAAAPLIFLALFIGAEFLLPKEPKTEKGLPKIALKVTTILLVIGIIACIASVLVLWKIGPFWRLK